MNLKLTNRQLYPNREKVYKVGDILTFYDKFWQSLSYNGSKWMLVFIYAPSEIYLVGFGKNRGVSWCTHGIKEAYINMEITETMIAKHFGVEFLEDR